MRKRITIAFIDGRQGVYEGPAQRLDIKPVGEMVVLTRLDEETGAEIIRMWPTRAIMRIEVEPVEPAPREFPA